MQVVFHIGAHCTGQDRLVRSLLKNRDTLAPHGVAVPGPGKYRRTLGEAIGLLKGAPASPETETALLDTILDSDDMERVVLSSETFICGATKVIEHGELYPRIGKSAWLRNAFPSADVEFAMALRNMSTFLPAIYDEVSGLEISPEAFLSGTDPRDLFWSEVIEAVRDANPEAPITVWCDEDSPILWPEIMRALCGIDPTVPLAGSNDLTRQLLSKEGVAKLEAAVAADPPDTEAARRRIVEDLLFDHADADAIEQEISLPDWSERLMSDLAAAYEDDLDQIARIPGVTLITP